MTKYHREGELTARDELVERFLPLARQLARRYQRGNEPLDDLVQVASIGLVKAVDRFDPERGTAFSSYAVPTILGELKRYFRDAGWAVHVPRGMQERVMSVNQAVSSCHESSGAPPPRARSRRHRPGPGARARGARGRDRVRRRCRSTRRGRAKRTAATPTPTRWASMDERFELVEYKSAIGPTMRALPARDRLVLKLRFEQDLTQLEIAERIGVSQMHVSRLIRRALKRLRTVADAQ